MFCLNGKPIKGKSFEDEEGMHSQDIHIRGFFEIYFYLDLKKNKKKINLWKKFELLKKLNFLKKIKFLEKLNI